MKRRFKTISKLPGVPINTIFEEIPITELSIYSDGYKKSRPNNHSFWYAPIVAKIPIFDLKDIEACKDVFEEIIESKTPKEIFVEVALRDIYIKNDLDAEDSWNIYKEKLDNAGYEIVKQVKSEPAKMKSWMNKRNCQRNYIMPFIRDLDTIQIDIAKKIIYF